MLLMEEKNNQDLFFKQKTDYSAERTIIFSRKTEAAVLKKP